MKIHKYLTMVGLSEREARVYQALLHIGPSTITRIVNETAIPSSKIYDVLERLEHKGLVSYILVKGKCTTEHSAHISDQCSIPKTYILVKCTGISEHCAHIFDQTSIPATYVTVKDLCIVEHISHICHTRHIPTRQPISNEGSTSIIRSGKI